MLPLLVRLTYNFSVKLLLFLKSFLIVDPESKLQ